MDDEIPMLDYVEEDDRNSTRIHVGLVGRIIGQPCLVVVAGPKSVGRIYRLHGPLTRIGRSSACDIVLDEEGVSRVHATVTLMPSGDVRIDDANSSNEIFFHGRKVVSLVMKDGDRVQLGNAALALLHIDVVDETVRRNLIESATEDDESRLVVRRHFRNLVERDFVALKRSGAGLSIVLFALDRFGALIDAYGRQEATMMLRKFGAVVRTTIARKDAHVGRYADDQVAVALPETSAEESARVAEWICRTIAASPMPIGTTQLTVSITASAGVAAMTADDASAEDLLERAERVLYRARIAGGGRVEI